MLNVFDLTKAVVQEAVTYDADLDSLISERAQTCLVWDAEIREYLDEETKNHDAWERVYKSLGDLANAAGTINRMYAIMAQCALEQDIYENVVDAAQALLSETLDDAISIPSALGQYMPDRIAEILASDDQEASARWDEIQAIRALERDNVATEDDLDRLTYLQIEATDDPRVVSNGDCDFWVCDSADHANRARAYFELVES